MTSPAQGCRRGFLVEHVVHEDHTFGGHARGDISLFAGHHVKVTLHFRCGECPAFWALAYAPPGTVRHEETGEDQEQRCAAHAAGL